MELAVKFSCSSTWFVSHERMSSSHKRWRSSRQKIVNLICFSTFVFFNVASLHFTSLWINLETVPCFFLRREVDVSIWCILIDNWSNHQTFANQKLSLKILFNKSFLIIVEFKTNRSKEWAFTFLNNHNREQLLEQSISCFEAQSAGIQ